MSRRNGVVRGNGGQSHHFRARGWRNWAGNQRTDPVRTVVACETGDVVDAVQAAARDGLRVKALGSGHSFTAIAVPDGVALTAPPIRRCWASTRPGWRPCPRA